MRDIRMAEYNAVTRYIRMCHVTPMRGIRIIGVIKRTSDIRGRKHAPSEVFAKTVIRERKRRNSGIFAAQARYPHKSVIRGRRPRIGTISVQMADVIARIYSCRYPRGSTGLADTELRVLRQRMTRAGYRAVRNRMADNSRARIRRARNCANVFWSFIVSICLFIWW